MPLGGGLVTSGLDHQLHGDRPGCGGNQARRDRGGGGHHISPAVQTGNGGRAGQGRAGWGVVHVQLEALCVVPQRQRPHVRRHLCTAVSARSADGQHTTASTRSAHGQHVASARAPSPPGTGGSSNPACTCKINTRPGPVKWRSSQASLPCRTHYPRRAHRHRGARGRRHGHREGVCAAKRTGRRKATRVGEHAAAVVATCSSLDHLSASSGRAPRSCASTRLVRACWCCPKFLFFLALVTARSRMGLG